MESAKGLILTRIPKFSGSHDESWETWIRRFETLSSSCKEDERLLFLLGSLEGKALDIAANIPTGKEKNYPSVVRTLQERFGDTVKPLQAFSLLGGAVREPGESVRDFGDRVTKLAALAFPAGDAGHVDNCAVQQFTCGLRDQRLQSLLVEREVATMEEATRLTEAAQRKQNVLDSLRTPEALVAATSHCRPDLPAGNQGSTSTDNEPDKWEAMQQSITAITASIQTLHSRVSQQESASKRNTRDFRCYACNEPGHMKRECPTRRLQGSQRTQRHNFERRCLACGQTDHWMVDCPRLPAMPLNPKAEVFEPCRGNQ